MASSCIIVGAGISGLMAAHTLQTAGWDVVVVDKGRGVGGRMATRRFNDAIFDHGAQFFTVRDPKFAAWVEQWQAAGIVEVWSNGLPTPDEPTPTDGYPRYRGVPSMTAIAKHLAPSLNVHTNTRITNISLHDAWILTSEDGQTFTSDALLMTPPVPQSLALFAESGIELPHDVESALSAIEYNPAFAVMAVLDAPTHIPAPGALQILGEPIGWLADNQQKGVSPAQVAVTIHAGPQFTATHFDDDQDTVAHTLIGAARPWLGDGNVISYQVHRWRYSQPINPYPERYLMADMPLPLVFAGDAFGGPRVEGAALSGMAAAEALLKA